MVGISNFEYRNITDEAMMVKQQILEEKFFKILPSELFCNILRNVEKN